MPDHHHTGRVSNQEFIAGLMGRVRDILPLLNPDEIADLLGNLTNSIDSTISLIEEDTSARDRQVGSIPDVHSAIILGEIHSELNRIEMERFLKLPSVPVLHESCTDYRDILAGKALELVIAEMTASGSIQPRMPFALISMGSDGRKEQTLITDQDYLIVYGDGGGKEADYYFTCFSDLLVERLAEMGFKKCTGGIMPCNPTWRGSMSQWKKKLLSIVRYEYEDYAKNLMDLIVLSDARHVAGDRMLAEELVDLIRDLEKEYFHALWGMAKAATEMKLALGFLKGIWIEGSGEHKGEFNLKLLAWAPLVMNIRIISINQGIPATSTLERIELLKKEGSFSASMAEGLKDAYHILTRYRIIQQIKVIKGIQKDSHYINPYLLPAEEREKMRQAIIRIEDLQKVIHANFHIV